MHISLKQLEIFVAIAKFNNVTQAANSLFISQAACSMALATFENQLDTLLFDRQGKRLVLNESGHLIFAKAVNILEQTLALQDILKNGTSRNVSGNLILGASTTIGNYLLPNLIHAFCNDFPQAKLKLEIYNSEQVIQHLLRFTIDIGLIEGDCHEDNIEVIPWCIDELAIIAAPKHPLAKKNKITRSDLLKEKWILREAGSGTRERFEYAMGESVTPFLELNQTEAIKQAVALGMGISCVSKATLSDALKNGQLVCLKIPTLKLTRQFSVVLNKNRHKSFLLTEFVSKLKR